MTILTGIGGLTGWNLLKRTADQQKKILAAEPQIARSAQHFRDKIASTRQASDLVGDYRLMSVALTAHGLEADIGSKAFIRNVLDSRINDNESLVNRLADKHYRQLATSFGYEFGNRSVVQSGFADRMVSQYIDREFELRVGEQDPDLRLALNAQREMRQIAGRSASDITVWYEVLGNPPLRKVFEGAFGFSTSYGKLPIDRQLAEFMKKSEAILGSSSFGRITSESSIDKLIQTFLLKSQISNNVMSSSRDTALKLLSGTA